MSNSESKKEFKSGEIIMQQGDPGTSAYIIEEGVVEIFIAQNGAKETSVGTRGEGAMIGEMALVDGAPRTATIKAIEDCKLLEITREDFSQRLEHADPILKMTTQVILTRYRDTLLRANITDQICSWPPVETMELSQDNHSAVVETVRIANDFKDALPEGDIQLHYQPMIDLQTSEACGFEALMRWNHPDKGSISPALFIPVIEDSGYIVQASQWALRESLLALKRIEAQAGFDNDLFMSVNFSSRDFAADEFVGSVYDTISESDVRPQNVHIEITERLLMGQPEQAKETLEMCSKAGMGISIDDFGTGYSSLSYLHYFPIDTLKIDQSFVRGMLEDDGIMELVKSIIALSKNMKMKTVAEGIEEREHAIVLRDLGCDIAQGYYFAKPASESDVTALLKDKTKFEF